MRMLVSEAPQARLLLLDDPNAMRRGEPRMSPRGPVESAWSIEARVGEAPHGHAGEMGEDLETRDDPHAATDAEVDFVPSARRARLAVGTRLTLDPDRVAPEERRVAESAAGALLAIQARARVHDFGGTDGRHAERAAGARRRSRKSSRLGSALRHAVLPLNASGAADP